VGAFDSRVPDLADPAQRVAFGTSGHPRFVADRCVHRAHILAITQAICDYRARAADERPALPRQGHARAVGPGAATALEVLAGNGVEVIFSRTAASRRRR
jgi:phosphoglucomutase